MCVCVCVCACACACARLCIPCLGIATVQFLFQEGSSEQPACVVNWRCCSLFVNLAGGPRVLRTKLPSAPWSDSQIRLPPSLLSLSCWVVAGEELWQELPKHTGGPDRSALRELVSPAWVTLPIHDWLCSQLTRFQDECHASVWGSVGGARKTHAKSPGQLELISDTPGRDFPGGPVVKAPCFHCKDCGFSHL